MPYYNTDPHLKHSLIFTRCFIHKKVVKDIDFNENSVEDGKWRYNHTISDHLGSSFWEQIHYIGTCCVQSWAAQCMDWLQKVQGRDTETQNLDNLLFKEIFRELGREKCHVDLSNAWRKGEDRARLLLVVPSERTRGKESPFKHQKNPAFTARVRVLVLEESTKHNQDRLPSEVVEYSSLEIMQWTQPWANSCDFFLSRRFDEMVSRDMCQPHPCSDCAILSHWAVLLLLGKDFQELRFSPASARQD